MPVKGPDGRMYDMLVANATNKRLQVWRRLAYKTSSGKKGLTKAGLKKHHGKLVSVKASKAAKRLGTLKKWMKKEGVVVKKGTFGLQKVGTTATAAGSHKRRKSHKRHKRRKSCRYKRSARHGKRHKGEYKHCRRRGTRRRRRR